MPSSTTSAVYAQVIEDVVNKVRDEFVNNGGPGEGVLSELQGIWEAKMMQAGVLSDPIERSSAPRSTPGGPITPVHDLNVPYEGSEEYETPTAEMLFPPTPIQTPLPGSAQTPLPGTAQTPLPGTAQTPLPGGTPITPNDYPSVNDTGGATEMKAGRPGPFTQPPSSWMNPRLPLSVDVNVAYVEGREEADRGVSHQPTTQDFFMMPSGKRKREDLVSQYNAGGYISQQDGAGDSISYNIEVSQGSVTRTDENMILKAKLCAEGAELSSRIPQLDGPISDPYDDVLSTPNIYNYQGAVNEDYNIVNTPAPNDLQTGTPAVVAQNDVGDDNDDEEPLNENDDDDELDDVDEGELLNTQHLVLAQFDKVTRTKSKWKCTLKDGIMHINDKDILFNKATGDFDF